jgi:hypothetical protein
MKRIIFLILIQFLVFKLIAQKDYVEIVNDNYYNAFPGLVQLSDGTLIAYYKKGTTHVGSNDIQVERRSNNLGITWSGETKVFRPDSSLKKMAGVQPTLLSNGELILAFSSLGVGFTKSTDNGLTWSNLILLNSSLKKREATSAKVIELPDGRLLCGFFGNDSQETFTSPYIMSSNDRGVSWHSRVRISNGETDSIDYQDPNLIYLSNGKIVCIMRTGNNLLYCSISNDTGISWSVSKPMFKGTGAPRPVCLADNKILVFYRSAINKGKIAMGSSIDNGLTWTSDTNEFIVDDEVNASGNGMMYASPVLLPNGNVAIVYAYEFSTSKADVRFKILDKSVGFNDIDEPLPFTSILYPNPSNGVINIDLSSFPNSEISYEIFNSLGQVNRSGNIKVNTNLSTKQVINIEGFEDGFYFIRIQQEKYHFNQVFKFQIIN